MSFFAAAGAVLGNVFGTPKSVERIVDTVSNGLDKMVYTEEEEAEAKAKATTEARNFLISWLDTTKGQNITRRALAIMITGTWISLFWFMVVSQFLAIWVDAKKDELVESATLFKDAALIMGDAMWLILLFYFAAPHMGKAIDVLLGRIMGRFK
ncbi:MAG: hypothetical protein ACPKM1_15710 [Spirochaetaceae bacterium]